MHIYLKILGHFQNQGMKNLTKYHNYISLIINMTSSKDIANKKRI